MIGFGDAFLALNVIPQAATAGARPAGALQVGSRGTCGRKSIVSARRSPRRHPVCTTLLRTEGQAGPQAINQIRVAAGFRARAQLQAVRVGNRFPCRLPPTKNEYVGRTQARPGGEEWRSGRRLAATCSSCPRRVVYDRVHYPRDRRVDAPTLGRYSEPSFFLDGVPPVVVRLARQREPPPTWEQGWQPREVADATAGTVRWARSWR